MDLTDQEQEERRERLRQWVRAAGGHATVVAKRRLTQGQASYLSQVMNGYSFGSRACFGGLFSRPRSGARVNAEPITLAFAVDSAFSIR